MSFGPGAMSRTLAESARKTRALYRDCLRASHLIVRIYGLDVPPPTLERAMRAEFEKHRHVSDLKVVRCCCARRAALRRRPSPPSRRFLFFFLFFLLCAVAR